MNVFDPDGTTSLGRHTKKFILGGLLVIVFSAIAVASAILLEIKDDLEIVRNPRGSEAAQAAPAPKFDNVLDDVEAGEPQTVLLLGSDRRFADIGKIRPRSDTIMLVRLDPDKHATAIMSLPRDLKVDIPGHGTRRINEAYHLGGAKLTIQTVQQFLDIDVHHVINVNFGGFRRAVDRLGCVYADVDRRYFNDNSRGENYATIDLKPGYQKLCGQDALDFVRYRHEDSDFVRGARQQEFLRQAKAQVGIGKLVSDRKELLRIFGAYTQSDIPEGSVAEVLGLLKLAYESSKNPVTEVRFPGTDAAGGYIEISEDALIETVDRFIDVRGKDPALEEEQRPKPIKPRKGLAPGLVSARRQGEDHVLSMDLRLTPLGLPVYYPRARLARGDYVRSGSPRSYELFDSDRKRHRAYRIVLYAGEVGEYYGVQATTWKSPPILEDFDDEVRMRGRTYRRYFDGRRIRLIAWETPKAVYWVSNTLSHRLTNSQMMDIARSLTRIDS